MGVDFDVDADEQATAWLATHPAADARAIDYDIQRCCGGGKVCSVTVRASSPRKHPDFYVSAPLPDGTEILIDRRAAKRLPARFRLTVRGVGPFRHLDLALTGDEWGRLLYT